MNRFYSTLAKGDHLFDVTVVTFGRCGCQQKWQLYILVCCFCQFYLGFVAPKRMPHTRFVYRTKTTDYDTDWVKWKAFVEMSSKRCFLIICRGDVQCVCFLERINVQMIKFAITYNIVKWAEWHVGRSAFQWHEQYNDDLNLWNPPLEKDTTKWCSKENTTLNRTFFNLNERRRKKTTTTTDYWSFSHSFSDVFINQCGSFTTNIHTYRCGNKQSKLNAKIWVKVWPSNRW